MPPAGVRAPERAGARHRSRVGASRSPLMSSDGCWQRAALCARRSWRRNESASRRRPHRATCIDRGVSLLTRDAISWPSPAPRLRANLVQLRNLRRPADLTPTLPSANGQRRDVEQPRPAAAGTKRAQRRMVRSAASACHVCAKRFEQREVRLERPPQRVVVHRAAPPRLRLQLAQELDARRRS